MPASPRLAFRPGLAALFLSLLGALALPAAAAPAPGDAAAGGETRRYLIELAEPPLATYEGGVPGLAATAPNAVAREALRRELASGRGVAPAAVPEASLPRSFGAARLDVASPAARAYGAHLRAAQDRQMGRIARLAPGATALYHYSVTFDGLAVRMTAAQADRVRRLEGVVTVTEEEEVKLFMDNAAARMKLDAAWADPRVGGRADAGKGMRVAIIDTGIAADHPMFDDTGFTAPSGFPKVARQVGDETTDLSGGDVSTMVNDKVIVARVYANPEIAGQLDIDALTPYPGNTHGTHVAGIAAGRVVQGAPNAGGWGEMTFSGMAPGAYLMAYRFDYGYTPEVVRMIEDAVADGADVINNSWGTA